jgi:hypothetical protein
VLSENISNRSRAFDSIRIEVFEKYHFGGEQCIPFQCLQHNCHKEFSRLGEYATHLHDPSRWLDHSDWLTNRVQKNAEYPPMLPTEIKDSLTAMAMEVLEYRQKYSKAWAHLREAWGNPGSETRLHYAEAFLDQLKNDPVLYSTACVNNPREHSLWHHLQETWDRLDAENEIMSALKSSSS